MARALIVGCGCRGRALGGALAAEGWQVRGTSRTPEGVAAIEAAGLEGALCDPDRVATVFDHLGDVTVLVWALASARGEPEAVAALHGARLERLLEHLVDTPVRGFVYEARGSVAPAQLESGREMVRAAAQRWRIPVALIERDPHPHEEWLEEARRAVFAAIST